MITALDIESPKIFENADTEHSKVRCVEVCNENQDIGSLGTDVEYTTRLLALMRSSSRKVGILGTPCPELKVTVAGEFVCVRVLNFFCQVRALICNQCSSRSALHATHIDISMWIS